VGTPGKLLVKLIVRSVPVGTVITTGDQTAGVVAAEFNARQLAVEPATAAPQL